MDLLMSEITSTQQNLIQKHLELLIEANKVTNLTRITSKEEARILHIEDSLVAVPELSAAPDGLYGDLGTGGGYPGIPLAIVSGRTTVLVDSVGKKTAVLDRIVQDLGLQKRISTYTGRIEELAFERGGAFSVLTARALTQLPSLLELAAPLLCLGGRLISYKANISDEELSAAKALEGKLGMKLASDRSLLLSDRATHRRILVFEKIAESTVKLPRRNGMAQKKPLK